ncbi:MAG: hypothetical protein E7231_12950 [Cellulosilyticum sp.]|nr:hypothetical protein [Cellulosilyticum sp.]
MLDTESCGGNSGTSCQFNHYQIGGVDGSGRKIEQIVYLEPDKYIIYYIEGDYLKPYYIDAYEFFAPFSEAFQKKLAEIRYLNIKNDKQSEFVRSEIASAYYNALNGYNEVAIGELEVLSKKLNYRAYAWWFTTYAVLCGLLTIISFTLYFAKGETTIHHMIYCMTASSVGSLLVHVRKETNSGIATFLPSIAAYIYFLGSVVSGFVVYCVLKSNLLLGELGNDSVTMILVCFVAGYSEDIPLKLIDKIGAMLGANKEKEK